MKEHRFILTVKTLSNRRAAKLAVLSAFGRRNPDGCEFRLKEADGHKEIWMAGAKAGTATAFELAIRSLENMRKKLGVRRIPKMNSDTNETHPQRVQPK